MKYCSHCGSELFDEAVICPKCGCPVEHTTATVEVKEPKLIPLALVGFILSIVSGVVSMFMFVNSGGSSSTPSILLGGLPIGVAGLVCSIIGLVKVKRNKQRGKGFAIAGIVVGAVVCALFLILLLIGLYFVALLYVLLLLLLGL